jgi:serine/threonine protein kinase
VPFHYLVLEYMPGGDLWSLCKKSPIVIDDALNYFQQIAEALAYAHSQHVIHRDIKPNNLLLSADRRVMKIADFGVAKMTHDDASEITRVGTNVYAPPEHHPDVRADDANEKLTPSADVYSLAKTIYTAMTGRAPRQFSREPISELPPELLSQPWSAPLLSVLARATASRVADRYQSVEAFWEDLARVRLAGTSDQVDDEATIVRSRLRTDSEIEQPAARPNFQTLANAPREPAHPQKARIVVDLPSHRERTADPAEEQKSSGAEGRSESPSDKFTTREFGSTSGRGYTQNDARGRSTDSTQSVVVAPSQTEPAERTRQPRVQTLRRERGLWDGMRFLFTSEWLRRVFIIFLAAALIGLAASTYYHFAEQKTGLPFFGSQQKDGRIAGATNVNLRSDPFGSVLVPIPAGTRLRVLEERAGWLKVRILEWSGSPPDNAPDTGWVDGRFVKID